MNEIDRTRRDILLYAQHALKIGPAWPGYSATCGVIEATESDDIGRAEAFSLESVSARGMDRTTLVAAHKMHEAVRAWRALLRHESDVRRSVYLTLRGEAEWQEQCAIRNMRTARRLRAGYDSEWFIGAALREGRESEVFGRLVSLAARNANRKTRSALVSAAACAAEAYALRLAMRRI